MSQVKSKNIDGLLTCARYAFMPNKLEYCGGDDNRAIFDYCVNFTADGGLSENLKNFQTLYPYLNLIAQSNKIEDPFDWRVVEAYWLGNSLLENVKMSRLFYHLIDDHQLKKKLTAKALRYFTPKIPAGAKPHHSFHVLNVPKRTGHYDVSHSIETMDKCRISWGQIVDLGYEDDINIKMIFRTRPLVYKNNQISLGNSELKAVNYQFQKQTFLKEPKPGDWISAHWDWACDILTPGQVRNLEFYTQYHINLANQF